MTTSPLGTCWPCRWQARRVLQLAGPRATLAEGLRRAATIAGTPAPRVLPAAMVAATALASGVVGRLLPLSAQYAAESLRAGLATYYGNPAKAEQELGWSCRSLDEGLRQTINSPGM